MANQGDRFRRRALSRGYKVDEVDAFLDRVEATLSGEPMGTPVPSQEVDDVVFRVRFGGYDEWQVDVYLDRVARQLGELEERGVLGRAPAPEFATGPSADDSSYERADRQMSDEYEAAPRETAMMSRPEPSPPRDREMGFPPREPSPPRDREMGFPPREPSPPRDREMGFPPREPSPPRDREMGFPPREPSPPRDREMGFPPREPSPPREPMRADDNATMMMPQPSPPRGREPGMHDEPPTPPPPPAAPPPPAGARGGRAAVEDDGESFAHLRPDDSEGFAHLRGGDDDYDDPFAGYSPKSGTPTFDQGGDDFAAPGRPAHMDEPPTERFGPPTGERGFGPPRGPHQDDEFAPPPGAGRPGGMMPPPPPPPPVSDQWQDTPDVAHGAGYGGGFEDEMTRPVRRQVFEPEPEPDLAPRLRRGGNDERFTPPPLNRRMEPSPPNESQMMDSQVSPSTPPGGLRHDADAPTMAHPVVSQPPASPPGRPPSPYDDPQGYRDFGRPAGPPVGPHGDAQADAKVDYGRRNPYEGRGMFDEPGQHGREEMTTEMRTGDSPFGPQDLQRVEQLRGSFQPRRFGSGYDPTQVNRMFDAMSANMTARSPVPVTDKELDTSQFSLVQQGYFEAEVDAALREVRDIFAKRGMVR